MEFVTKHQRSGRVGVYGTNKVFQPVFDTYSSHYERDGYLQQLTANGMFWRTDNPSASTVDLGANGFDDDGTYGADDLGERETLPPFPEKRTPFESQCVSRIRRFVWCGRHRSNMLTLKRHRTFHLL